MILLSFLLFAAVGADIPCPSTGQPCYCGDCASSTPIAGSSVGVMLSNGFCNTYDGKFCSGTFPIIGAVCSSGSCSCCALTPGVLSSEEICFDGIDNNGDNLVDCADPQCDGRLCQAPVSDLAALSIPSLIFGGEVDAANLPSITSCNRNVCFKEQCVAESNLLEGHSCCESAAFVGSTLQGLCQNTSTGLVGKVDDFLTAIHGGDALITTNNEKCHYGSCVGCVNPALVPTLSEACKGDPDFNLAFVISQNIPLFEKKRTVCFAVTAADGRGRVSITDVKTVVDDDDHESFDVRGLNVTESYFEQFVGMTYTVQSSLNEFNGARRIELLCLPNERVCTAEQIIFSASPFCYAEFITNGNANTLEGGDKRALPALSNAATLFVGGSVVTSNSAFAAVAVQLAP